MANLLRRLSGQHAFFIAISSVLLGGFQFLFCGIVSTVNVSGVFEELMKSVPPFFRTMVEEQFLGGLTTRGILAFGWNHPIPQALGTALAIVLAARAVAGEVETGVLELVLTQPLSRARYFGGQVAFALSALVVLSLAGIFGTMFGQEFFSLETFPAASLLKLGFNFVLLQCAWFGVTLMLSAFGRERGRVAMTAFVLALVSYLVQVIGRFWPRADFLLPCSLHSYYSPKSILVDGILETKSVAVLLSVMVVSIAFGAWHFQRRDIP